MAAPNFDRSRPVAGMMGLEVLDIAGTFSQGCWDTLKSLTAVNSITTYWSNTFLEVDSVCLS